MFHGDQWALRVIRAPEVWNADRVTGAGIKVAVLDSGVDASHEDLDCRGKIHVIPGADVVRVASHPGPDDVQGHGTFIAGIIVACTNNGIGMAGVAPDATLVPIRIIGKSGPGETQNLVKGIRIAVRAGVHVINLSVSYPAPSGIREPLWNFPALEEAIQDATSKGVVVVASAGNNLFPLCNYPAVTEEVLCVGATDRRDQKAWYSNFPHKEQGPAVVAPGGSGQPFFCDYHREGIVSLVPVRLDRCNETLDGYTGADGTSPAVAHVSGVAALLYDHLGGRRRAAKARRVVDAIVSGAIDLGVPGYDPIFGSGRVDAVGALRSLGAPR